MDNRHDHRNTDSYGAVVIENGDVLLIDGGLFWSFRKGHLEDGETPGQAAVREVYEETGIKIAIIPGFSSRSPARLKSAASPSFLGRCLGEKRNPQLRK